VWRKNFVETCIGDLESQRVFFMIGKKSIRRDDSVILAWAKIGQNE